MQNSEYGIEAMVTKAIINPFSGTEPEKFSTFIIQITTALSAKEIPIPVIGAPWLETEQTMFASTDAELNLIVAPLTPIQQALNYAIGDLALTPANRKLYEKELKLNRLKKAHAIALMLQYVVPSSEAYNVIKPGSIIGNFVRMWWDLHDRYRGARLSVIIVQVERYVEIITSGTFPFIELNNVTAECKRAFAEILDLYNVTYDDNRKNAECVKVTLLWETLVDVVAFSKVSTEGQHIKDFIQRYVRENNTPPLQIDISLFLTQLKNYCNSCKGKSNNFLPKSNGDKIPIARAHFTQLQNEANKWRNSNKRKNPNDDNKTKFPKKEDKDKLHCTFCGKKSSHSGILF